MSGFDIFLIVLVFIVLIGFLVLIIIYGANVAGQVSTLGTRLEVAIQQSFVTFEALVNSVISTLQGFSDTAIKALTNIGAKVGQGFGAVATFFSDQVLSLIENITQEVATVSASFARTVTKGFLAASGMAASVVNEVITWVGGILTSIYGLISQAYTLVSQFISSLIIIVVNGVTGAIETVLAGILSIIQDIENLAKPLIADITAAIGDLKSDVQVGFKDMGLAINNVGLAVQELEPQLTIAYNLVYGAVSNIFDAFLCNILAPFCSKLPDPPITSSICDAIRDAGGCS